MELSLLQHLTLLVGHPIFTLSVLLFTLLASGAGVGTVVASVAVVNARLVLYAAVLEPRFRAQPGWFRWLAPHWIIEPTFALTTARDDLHDPTRFRRYWMALGALLAGAWTGLVALGVVVGPVLAEAAPVLAFAPAAVFLIRIRILPSRGAASAPLVSSERRKHRA